MVVFLFILGCVGTTPPKGPPGHTRPYRIDGKWYQPIPQADGFKERGIASWYGKKFHGRKTASGEIYNMYAMTAAHKTLPLGTLVRVRNLGNRKQIDVRINDRGPFVRHRIIDLSYAAAKEIGIVGPGTAEVAIRAIGSDSASGGTGPSDPTIDLTRGTFSFQIGAYGRRDNAEKQKRLLAKRYRNVRISPHDGADGRIYRVRVGRFTDLKQARKQERILRKDGYTDIFIVAE